MNKKWYGIFAFLVIVALTIGSLTLFLTPKEEPKIYGDVTKIQDEPEAHALYDLMVQTMREAKTLSYESKYQWGKIEYQNNETQYTKLGNCTYKIWMKMPNYTWLEVIKNEETTGVLVGDGSYFWIFWPHDRLWFSGENESEHEKTSSKVYMKRVPISIGHQVSFLGPMAMTIIDPSTFHGYTDSLQPYIDGVRSLGTEKVGEEDCDIVEVSIMDHQRSWYLWLSQTDHLPRKLKEVVRVSRDLVTTEEWSRVIIDADIPTEKFMWKPPEDWREWNLPTPEERLLKPGVTAPDFTLTAIDGNEIKLSDYQGKVVLLVFWRVGCPPCREEIPQVEKLYKNYRERGLVVIGFNCADDKNIALDFLRENSVTFPNIVDTSELAVEIAFSDYGMNGGVPLNYLIDRDQNIVDAWYGYDEERALQVF